MNARLILLYLTLISGASILTSSSFAEEACVPAIIRLSNLSSKDPSLAFAVLESSGVKIIGFGATNLLAVAKQEATNRYVTEGGFPQLASTTTPEIFVHAHIPNETLPLLARTPEVGSVEYGLNVNGTLWPEEIQEFKNFVLPKLAEIISELLQMDISIDQLYDLNPNSDISKQYVGKVIESISREARARNYEFKLVGSFKIDELDLHGIPQGRIVAIGYLFIVTDIENRQHRWDLRIQPNDPNILISIPGEWIPD